MLSILFFCLYAPVYRSWMKQCAMLLLRGTGLFLNTGQADFSESEMRYVEKPGRELDQLTYEIILRNTGSGRPEHVELGKSFVFKCRDVDFASPELAYNVVAEFCTGKGSWIQEKNGASP